MDSSIPFDLSASGVRPVSIENRTAIAVNRLRAAASQVRVDEASEVLAQEFAADLEAIADGEFSHEALKDAVITLARVRGWRRAWG